VDAVELSALVEGTAIKGLLMDAPEPFAWGTRVKATAGGQALTAVPNADRTRAFLFRPGVASWSAADTTLRLTFDRDAGASLPVLTVAGDHSQEKVDLLLHLGALS
jgi:hypothetical protein